MSLATLVNLRRPGSGHVGVDATALSASVYWVSQLSAFFYPGTASVDPPGKDNWPQLRLDGTPVPDYCRRPHLSVVHAAHRRESDGGWW